MRAYVLVDQPFVKALSPTKKHSSLPSPVLLWVKCGTAGLMSTVNMPCCVTLVTSACRSGVCAAESALPA
jgi:hypothetical protein